MAADPGWHGHGAGTGGGGHQTDRGAQPELNAVIQPHFEAAADRPGVPFLVKDVLATEATQPYHCGLRAARDAGYTAGTDSWLVRRYQDAGFSCLGRTTTAELANSLTTEPLAYGPTRNPWGLSRSPGGSSGGSAGAVACGMVAAAHGNDMAGSLRVPASHCGLVGLKPTRARASLAPEFGEFRGPITCQHVLTRTVRDSAAILDATAGAAPGDPYTAAPSPGGGTWRAEVGADPGRLRVGFRTAMPGGSQPHPGVTAAVAAAARLLEALGHHVEQSALAALDEPGIQQVAPVIFGAAAARDTERWSAALGHDITSELEAPNRALAELGRAITAAQWLAALETIHSWARRMAAGWASSPRRSTSPASRPCRCPCTGHPTACLSACN